MFVHVYAAFHPFVCLRTFHKWAKCKKPTKNGNENFGKLTVLTYACNNLTNLEYEIHPLTGNGNVESGFKKP